MQYLGSKNKIAKHILPIMLSSRKPNQYWVEPFVGGCNVIDKVDGRRIGADRHEYLIALWKALQEGYVPPTDYVSREFWYEVARNRTSYPKELVGFVGFLCSFGGKWFGGHAFNSRGTNYALSGSRTLVKQVQNLKDVIFRCCSYEELVIPEDSLIYCDPPYAGTTGYRDEIDHEKFWEWCRVQTRLGHTVFVSEYSAPPDFICVAEIPLKSVLNKHAHRNDRIERLFTYK